jgi:hypothetical protein
MSEYEAQAPAAVPGAETRTVNRSSIIISHIYASCNFHPKPCGSTSKHYSLSMPGASPSPTGSNAAALTGARNLQERLHNLLTKLSKTIEVIKDWKESDGDDASIHHKTTTKLISSIMDVIVSLESVEGVVKADNTLRKSLQDCAVPINLLDLLDHGNGLNPGKQ